MTDSDDSNSSLEAICKHHVQTEVKKFIFDLGGFGSLVETIMINFPIFTALLLLYTFLSKRARIEDAVSLSEYASKLSWRQLFYGDTLAAMKNYVDVRVDHKYLGNPNKYFFWLFAMFRIRDEDILQRSGIDAVQFLSFERHVIFFAIIISFISVVVIIPINFLGNLEPKENLYARLTLGNLSPKSNLIWVHPIASLVYFFICMIIMRHFSALIEVRQKHFHDRRSVMISGISKEFRQARCLTDYLEVYYPNIIVEDVQFAFNVKRLTALNEKRIAVESSIDYCEEQINSTGERPTLIPRRWGYFYRYYCCCCLNKCKFVDSLDFYSEKRNKLVTKFLEEKEETVKTPLGIAFVTFQNPQMAYMYIVDEALRKKTMSTEETYEFVSNWDNKYSPSVGNIFWEHLHVSKKSWYLDVFFVNISLLLFIFFLTTPNIIYNVLGLLKITDFFKTSNPFLAQYFPTLILLLLSVCLPLVVAYSNLLLPYYTRSELSLNVTVKTFVYLLLMVVILPSTEFTSVDAIFTSFISNSSNADDQYRWDCVFLADHGKFFGTYLIQSGFIGTVLQLLRFPELIMYTILTLFSYSEAECLAVRKAVLFEYDIGLHYAYFLLNASVVIIFAIPTPMVAPCGLIYLIFKYFLDRYNIYFTYAPSIVNRKVHATAINLIIFCFVVQQFFLISFVFLRGGVDGIFLVCVGGFSFAFVVFLVQLFLPSFHYLHWLAMPHSIKKIKYAECSLFTKSFPREPSSLEKVEDDVEIAEEDTFRLAEEFVPEVLKAQFS